MSVFSGLRNFFNTDLPDYKAGAYEISADRAHTCFYGPRWRPLDEIYHIVSREALNRAVAAATRRMDRLGLGWLKEVMDCDDLAIVMFAFLRIEFYLAFFSSQPLYLLAIVPASSGKGKHMRIVALVRDGEREVKIDVENDGRITDISDKPIEELIG